MEHINLAELSQKLFKKSNKILYKNNEHLFTKIAFDVYQFNDSPVESLWILEDGDDGEQYLVAQYEDDDAEGIEVKSSWLVLSDRESKNVSVSYKDCPIQRFASSKYGFGKDDVHVFKSMLLEKLHSDNSFVESFLNNQPKDKKADLLKKFPELLIYGGKNE